MAPRRFEPALCPHLCPADVPIEQPCTTDLESFFWRKAAAASHAAEKAEPSYENGWNALSQAAHEQYSAVRSSGDEHTRAAIIRGGSYHQPQNSVWYFVQTHRGVPDVPSVSLEVCKKQMFIAQGFSASTTAFPMWVSSAAPPLLQRSLWRERQPLASPSEFPPLVSAAPAVA
jgi:hypothetical protein